MSPASLSFSDSSLSSAETSQATPPATPPSTYRSVSPSPPSYNQVPTTSKPYLTVEDLYMRYIPLSKLQSRLIKPTATKILPVMNIYNLYQKFGKQKQEKPLEKTVLTYVKPQPKFPASRQPNASNLIPQKNTKTLFSVTRKSIAQVTTTQHQSTPRPTKHDALINVYIDSIRDRMASSLDSVMAVKNPMRFRAYDIPWRRSINKPTKDPDILI